MSMDISHLEQKIIYLDKNAPRGGDGTAAKPYRCFSCAFDAAKRLLSSLSEPAHVVLDVKGGDYTLSETLTLSGADMPRAGSHFTLRGDGNVVLSHWKRSPQPILSRQAKKTSMTRPSKIPTARRSAIATCMSTASAPLSLFRAAPRWKIPRPAATAMSAPLTPRARAVSTSKQCARCTWTVPCLRL